MVCEVCGGSFRILDNGTVVRHNRKVQGGLDRNCHGAGRKPIEKSEFNRRAYATKKAVA